MMALVSFDDVVASRRSIRRYERRAISDALLREVLDLARHAPSSMNGQPCHFVVVRDAATLRRLAAIKNRYCPPEKSAYSADFLMDAPAAIVVCVERARSFGREIENGILATAFLLLAARRSELGAVFLSAYQHGDPGLAAEIRATLSLPDGLDPITIVPLGFPGQQPAPKALRPLDEIVHKERFAGELRVAHRHEA